MPHDTQNRSAKEKKKESISNPHFLQFHLTPVGLAFLPQPHVPVLTMSNQYCDLTVLLSHQVAQRSICSWQMRDFKACSDQSSSFYFVYFHCGWVYSGGKSTQNTTSEFSTSNGKLSGCTFLHLAAEGIVPRCKMCVHTDANVCGFVPVHVRGQLLGLVVRRHPYWFVGAVVCLVKAWSLAD